MARDFLKIGDFGLGQSALGGVVLDVARPVYDTCRIAALALVRLRVQAKRGVGNIYEGGIGGSVDVVLVRRYVYCGRPARYELGVTDLHLPRYKLDGKK